MQRRGDSSKQGGDRWVDQVSLAEQNISGWRAYTKLLSIVLEARGPTARFFVVVVVGFLFFVFVF